MNWVRVVCFSLNCVLLSQLQNSDYPSWFLDPPNGSFVIGIGRNLSVKSESLKEAWIDALSMHDFYHDGIIRTNVIAHRRQMADSLMLKPGEFNKIPYKMVLKESVAVGGIYIGLFQVSQKLKNSYNVKDSSLLDKERLRAIGKQTIHSDRIYESWVSAEIEAFKEL